MEKNESVTSEVNKFSAVSPQNVLIEIQTTSSEWNCLIYKPKSGNQITISKICKFLSLSPVGDHKITNLEKLSCLR